MRKFCILILALLIFTTSSVVALSTGSAPGYGGASHLDDDFFLAEWFGVDGGSADGLSFGDFDITTPSALSMDVTLDNFFDDGSFEWLSVWIDWDHNSIFEDDELVLGMNDVWFNNGTTSIFTDVTANADAIIGDTWMRARITADGPLASSGDYFAGEIEDLQINVTSGPPMAAIPEPATVFLFALGLTAFGLRASKK